MRPEIRPGELLSLVLVEHAELDHPAQHDVAAGLRGLPVLEGGVRRGGAWQPSQERCLPHGELGHALAEVRAGGRLHSVRPVAEVDLIQIHLENAVLRVAPLQLEGEGRLPELALQALVRGEEEHLGELLRDRAPPSTMRPRR